ncbi:hypothetical protein LAY57_34800 [Argonema antarcticum A004/B2]|nr:hypothetical protein [Argonema antarcticum A004/B2]
MGQPLTACGVDPLLSKKNRSAILKKTYPIEKMNLLPLFYTAIDRTQWGLINLIVVSLIYEKRAIPIYFEILPKLGNTNSSKQIEVLFLSIAVIK